MESNAVCESLQCQLNDYIEVLAYTGNTRISRWISSFTLALCWFTLQNVPKHLTVVPFSANLQTIFLLYNAIVLLKNFTSFLYKL